MTGDPDHTLLRGAQLGDFHQITFAHDLSYAHRQLQISAEVFLARFDVQQVGSVATTAYYVETRYKLTPQLFTAFRWGQQFFGDVLEEPWDGRAARGEVAFGYRFSRRVQGKFQYSVTSEKRPVAQGKQFAAVQMTLRF